MFHRTTTDIILPVMLDVNVRGGLIF